MNQKKQRKFKININAKQGEQIGIRFSKNKLKIHGISDNRVSVSLYYEREEKKNDKVTTSYFADNNVQPVSEEEIMEQYSQVYVMDTNTDKRNGKKKCICVVGKVEIRDNRFALRKLLNFNYEIEEDDNNFEKYSWCYFIQLLKDNPNFDDNQIAIFVDSDLGKLGDYNSGKEILPGFVLPSNIKLMYSSADKSGDNLFTWAIKQCDNQANIIKKQI